MRNKGGREGHHAEGNKMGEEEERRKRVLSHLGVREEEEDTREKMRIMAILQRSAAEPGEIGG